MRLSPTIIIQATVQSGVFFRNYRDIIFNPDNENAQLTKTQRNLAVLKEVTQ